VIPQAAWSIPAGKILQFIPAPTLPGDAQNYSDNSQKKFRNDDKIGRSGWISTIKRRETGRGTTT